MPSSTHKKVGRIIANLSTVRSDLETLPKDISSSLNFADVEQTKKWMQFLEEFKNLLEGFKSSSESLINLVKDFTGYSGIKPPIPGPGPGPRPPLTRTSGPHSLYEDFTGNHVSAFVFDQSSPVNVSSWAGLTCEICRILANIDFEHLYKMAVSGVAPISSSDYNMRTPRNVVNKNGKSIWLETNHSAKNLVGYIRRLLETCNVPSSSVKIFLREDENSPF